MEAAATATDASLPDLGPGPDGGPRYLVVLSDIHLGTDAPTVWYQRAVHEPILRHLLGWIGRQAAQVREVVLLGDVVDLWTYPGRVRPPRFRDIVASHPATLGPDGALVALLDEVPGGVTYVPGNHDQGVTPREVGAIRSRATGRKVRLVDDVPYLPLGQADPRIALAHGHHWTMFNAPHATNPWAPHPLGFFVTRTVATMWDRRLEPGATVADLAGQGAPNGIDLGSLGTIVGGLGARSVTASVIDFVRGATGVALDEPIVMPDGTVATLEQARTAYESLWTEWADGHGGGVIGSASALRAALADADGTCIGWFAQRLAFEVGAELVVFGHTHVPVVGLEGGAVRYLNTGFDCPSVPDMERADAPQRATFAVVDLVEATAELREVAHDPDGLACRPAVAGPARVVAGGQDFSAYVTVDHREGRVPLLLDAATAPYGAWVVPPPERIEPGTVARFWIQDQLGPSGTEGTATYRGGGEEFALRFTCPTLSANAASGTPRLATRVGDGPWREGSVERRGHPLHVRFTTTR